MSATDDARADASDKPLRLFFALWPDDATREALQILQMHVHGRRTRVENLHATLTFLGNQPAVHLPVLKTILADLPRIGFTLQIDRLGYFKRKHIAWAGSHATPKALVTLQESLAQALMRHGIAFDRKNDFTPHITLARDAEPPLDRPFDPFTWEVKQIALVQSTQEGGRLAYQVLVSRHLEEAD
ncbi:RNA 2',3'-cyclic phosphodiesterase [Noviherbaspirillum sedimenti]|uniref:RNA 2',3'-cyclic phosphodiesterase n=1 Tax=Noviherbaspirillum sedimenti TaxID=2320865 RepID=A0A3A3G7B7_9BURK|nr:RNA 2',3'-cyclic phosphodiesterase [Noviherbaspirillum sedimenti]RJG03851.1 RNA 2',3'-cyclic phosphodiesterase [Noviherbaspirillum sedimenti]